MFLEAFSIVRPSVAWTALGLFVALLFVGKVPLRYNLRNLAVRWRTTLLTALAFTLVIGLLVVMLAFVNGMYQLTESSGQPGNVVILADGATDEIVSNLAYGDTADIELQPGVLRSEKGRPIASREVYLVVNQPLPAIGGNPPKRRFMQVRGVEDAALAARIHGLKLLPGGSFLSQAGVQVQNSVPAGEKKEGATRNPEQLIEAVIGQGMAAQWGRDRNGPPLKVGDIFELGPRHWIVVGMLQSEGSTFSSEVWAKHALVGPMFGKENYSTIVVRATDADAAQKLASFYNLDYKKSALHAQTETEYFSKLSESNKQFLVAIIFVALFMALGGVFGVMNTMFAAITARAKDIGVLRILGYARWQILVSFLLESLLLAIIGGAIGCGLGCFADGLTATSIVSAGQGGGGKFVVLKLLVTANTLTAGMLLALFMGTVGGIVPALWLTMVRPIEALR